MATGLVAPFERFFKSSELDAIPEPLKQGLTSYVQNLYNLFLEKTADLERETEAFQRVYNESEKRLHDALEDRSKLQECIVSLKEEHLKICQAMMKLEDRDLASLQRIEELELQLSSAEDCKAELAEMLSHRSAEITALEERLRREKEVRSALAKEKCSLELRLVDRSIDKVALKDAREEWSLQKEMLDKEKERFENEMALEMNSVRCLKEELQRCIAQWQQDGENAANRFESVQSEHDKLASSMDLLNCRIVELMEQTNQISVIRASKVSDAETAQTRVDGKIEAAVAAGVQHSIGRYQRDSGEWEAELAEKTMRIRELEELVYKEQSKRRGDVEKEKIAAENVRLQEEVARAHNLISDLLSNTISLETIDELRKVTDMKSNESAATTTTVDPRKNLGDEMLSERDDNAERRLVSSCTMEAVLRDIMQENSFSRNVVDLRAQNRKLLSILGITMSDREHLVREDVKRNVVEANHRLEQFSAMTADLCKDNAETRSHLAKVIVERDWYKEEMEKLSKLASETCCGDSDANSNEELMQKNAKLQAVSQAYDYQVKSQNETVENLSRLVEALKDHICSLEADRRRDCTLICQQKEQLEGLSEEVERMAQRVTELSEQNRSLKEQLSSVTEEAAVSGGGRGESPKGECLSAVQLDKLNSLLCELKTIVFPVGRHAERDNCLAKENEVLLCMLSKICKHGKVSLENQRANVCELSLQLDEKAGQVDELRKRLVNNERNETAVVAAAAAATEVKSKKEELRGPLGNQPSLAAATYGSDLMEGTANAVHSELSMAASRQLEQNTRRLTELSTRLAASENDLEEYKFLCKSLEESLTCGQENATLELNEQKAQYAALKRTAEALEQQVIELTKSINSGSASHSEMASSFEERTMKLNGELCSLKKENAILASQLSEQTERLTCLESTVSSLRQVLEETANKLAVMQDELAGREAERGSAQEEFACQQGELNVLRSQLMAVEDGHHSEVESMNNEIRQYRKRLCKLEKVSGELTRLLDTLSKELLLHDPHCSTLSLNFLADVKELPAEFDFDSTNRSGAFAQLVERFSNCRRLAFSRVLVAETQMLSYRVRNELVEFENRRLRRLCHDASVATAESSTAQSNDAQAAPFELSELGSGEKSLYKMLDHLRSQLEMHWNALFIDYAKEVESCDDIDEGSPPTGEPVLAETEAHVAGRLKSPASLECNVSGNGVPSDRFGGPTEVALSSSSLALPAIRATEGMVDQSRLLNESNRPETSSEATGSDALTVHFAQSSSFCESAAVSAPGVSSSDGAHFTIASGDRTTMIPSLSSSSPPPVESSQGIISTSWEVDNEGISSSSIVEAAATSEETGLSTSSSSDLCLHPKRDFPSFGEFSKASKRRRVASPVLVSTTGEDEEAEPKLPVQSLAERMGDNANGEHENGAASTCFANWTNRHIATGEEDTDMSEQPESSGQGLEAGDVIEEELQIEETSEAVSTDVDSASRDNLGSPERGQHSS
ncbi:putative host-nuclease inhibitor protein Gam [Trichuris suis]|uniref:Nucleoprotein TPR n=1 Tax=Trichuris suis TaxID=68888 RepID=A0A085MBF6_9BILA|nr:hypothetical protein M513_04497 [Trichuris suis]KHJ49602.1 putative host-nuclease inhibitor protein Gam [Trichuris suis]